MNKKILAAAVAAAMVAPAAAFANDVTIYGIAHISVDYLDADGPTKAAEDRWDGWDMSSNASRLGFKGTEDLSNGLKAIWKMEFGVDMADAGASGPDLNAAIGAVGDVLDMVEDGDISAQEGAEAIGNYLVTNVRGTALGWLGSPTAATGTRSGSSAGNNLWSARNAYVGLAGGFGTFLIGRHDTPYKMSTGKLDLFADTLADYNSTLLFTDIRVGSAIAYVSPNWGGFSFAAAGVVPHLYAGSNTSLGLSSSDADGMEAYSVAATYDNAGFFAAVAFEQLNGKFYDAFYNLGDAGLDDDQKWRVGLGWTGAGFTIGAVYENQDNVLGLPDTDKESWQVSAGYTFGNNMVKAMYGQVDLNWLDDAVSEDWDSWAVGLDHNFSKRTSAYILYTDVSTDVDVAGLGGDDADRSGFSVGMIHKF